MPIRKSKKSFIKVIFFQMTNALKNNTMHSCILHLFLQVYRLNIPWAFCKMQITWTQSRNHNRFITCEAAYVNRECRTRYWRRASQSLYLFKWLMHSLTTLSTHYAPICADKMINFHISLLQYSRHMNSNTKPSLTDNLWSSTCK